MPYRRKNGNRRYRRRRPMNKKAVQAIARKEVDKRIENKVVFGNVQNNAFDNTGLTFSLTTSIAQGTTALTRIGDKISLQRYSFKGNLKLNASATSTSVRMLVLKVYEPGYSPVVSDLFFYNGTAGYEITSPINYPESKGRYAIMRDKTFTLTTEKNELNFKGSIKFRNCQSCYDRSGNAQTKHIHVVFISDQAVNTPTLDFSSYLSFQDA